MQNQKIISSHISFGFPVLLQPVAIKAANLISNSPHLTYHSAFLSRCSQLQSMQNHLSPHLINHHPTTPTNYRQSRIRSAAVVEGPPVRDRKADAKDHEDQDNQHAHEEGGHYQDMSGGDDKRNQGKSILRLVLSRCLSLLGLHYKASPPILLLSSRLLFFLLLTLPPPYPNCSVVVVICFSSHLESLENSPRVLKSCHRGLVKLSPEFQKLSLGFEKLSRRFEKL
jgi:hypothetical protein